MPNSIKQPTHDEIALRAHQLWKDRGSHHGEDVGLWFEAERQLNAAAALAADENHGHAPDMHVHAANNGQARPADQAEHSSPESNKARAQSDQHKVTPPARRRSRISTGPAPKPPVSGKPIFPKPHSS